MLLEHAHLSFSFCSLVYLRHVRASNQITQVLFSSPANLTTARSCLILTLERLRSIYRPPLSHIHHACMQTHQPVPSTPFALSSAYPLLCTKNSTRNRHLYFHKSPLCQFRITKIYSQKRKKKCNPIEWRERGERGEREEIKDTTLMTRHRGRSELCAHVQKCVSRVMYLH